MTLMKALRPCLRAFIVLLVFSFADNILMLVLPIYMMQIYDRVLTSRNIETLVSLTVIALGLLIAWGLLDAIRARILWAVGSWIDSRFGPELYERVVAASLRSLAYKTEAMRDLQMVRSFIGGPSVMAFFDMPWAFVFIAVIALLHPVLGALALAAAVVLIILAIVNEFVTRGPLRASGEASRVNLRAVDEAGRNAEIIDAMGMMPRLVARWQSTNGRVLELAKAAANRGSTISAVSKFLRFAIQISMLGIGAYLVIKQEMTSGAMIAGSIILGRALAPVDRSIAAWKQFIDTRAAFGRLQRLMAAALIRPASLPLPPPLGNITAEGVSFSLTNGRNIVTNVGFRASPGHIMAIIGASGAGKSTIGRLILGIWPPTAGTLRFDGADIATWNRENLGKHIGYLPQGGELFAGSVAQNIARLGDATAEATAVVVAAKLAGAHEMILRLPRGYDSEVGDGGSSLSGGQRQRIALARALFGDPQVIVLDEPSAFLDGDGEQALLQTLLALKRAGRTIIVITHQTNILAAVDHLLVIKNGAGVLFGPRLEVMKRLSNHVVALPQRVAE